MLVSQINSQISLGKYLFKKFTRYLRLSKRNLNNPATRECFRLPRKHVSCQFSQKLHNLIVLSYDYSTTISVLCELNEITEELSVRMGKKLQSKKS
jgi:hypothetical protein